MNIENQFPEYIREQFPDFVRFVELYFDFLNSAEIVYSSGIGNLTIDSILTGDVSSTTTKITGIDPTNNRIFVTKQNSLVIGEILSDGSGNSCKIVSYTPNPSQTISELLNYKNLDETRSTLFEKYRSDLMTVIPNRLEKSVDIPNLIKNIKSLYVQKGTTESYKTLFSLLFNEYVEIYYPAYDMLELSAGEWSGRYSIEVDVVNGNPFNIIATDVTLTTPTFKTVITPVSYIRRISFTRFEMYFQDKIEAVFAVEGTSIVGSGFTGVIPPSTSIVSYGGEHKDNKGFVSDSNYLQNKYYQKYSYVVKSNVVSDSYKSIIKGALHPAGLIEFDELVITNLLSVSDALRVLKAEFIKSFNEGLDTADDTLFSIFKVLIDSISITDLYTAVINKNILDEGFVATDNDIKSIIKSLTDTLESTSLIDDISSMGINRNILDDIYTTDDALRSIIKSLTDSSSVNDLSSLGINKGIIDSFGFSHTQQIDKNPYAVDYFNQPVVGTDAYTDSRI